MLYLFGQLALSDSLFYHEDYLDDNFSKDIVSDSGSQGGGAAARAALVSRRLRRERHLAAANRPVAGRRA